ncbi:hypothetical protein [Brevundimonas sp.]|uniref:hypothetical protein n=1 Tax=Brevundimonas sp. TaxID=1871086 RepID=UPI003F6FFBFE
MGPEFWARWDRWVDAHRRRGFLFYLQVFPPACAAVGACLAVSVMMNPFTPDRANMIAIGVLAFVAGGLGTALVLYVRMLVRRLRARNRRR